MSQRLTLLSLEFDFQSFSPMKTNPHLVHDFSSQQILVAQKKDSGPEPCLADFYHSPVFMSQPKGTITQLYDRRMERHISFLASVSGTIKQPSKPVST
jgi:hypothetical protein